MHQIRPRQREWFALSVHAHAASAPTRLVIERDDCSGQAVERRARLQVVYDHPAADLVLSRVDAHGIVKGMLIAQLLSLSVSLLFERRDGKFKGGNARIIAKFLEHIS